MNNYDFKKFTKVDSKFMSDMRNIRIKIAIISIFGKD